jgi:nucleotide-binding universal stress UspA family protein
MFTVDDPPGASGKGVVAIAAGLDASVIVVGSRGLSGALEVLERSLSQNLARRAGRPLLIVLPAARCG